MADNKCTVVKFKGYLKYVDLGLPSGIIWATVNVGARSPLEYGLYFSWGNVDGHADNSGYDYGTSSSGPYAQTSGAALKTDIPVGDDYDAARHYMGTPWSMPSKEDYQELYDNCNAEWTSKSGVYGILFTSKINGNSVFFPASGYGHGTTINSQGSSAIYWSKSRITSANAYYMNFNDSAVTPQGGGGRYFGSAIRGIIKPIQNS